MNGILEMSWFVNIFLQNQHMVPIDYFLLRSYLDFQGQFRFFPMLMPKPCSSDFNFLIIHHKICGMLCILNEITQQQECHYLMTNKCYVTKTICNRQTNRTHIYTNTLEHQSQELKQGPVVLQFDGGPLCHRANKLYRYQSRDLSVLSLCIET